jgi:hypothetical protein
MSAWWDSFAKFFRGKSGPHSAPAAPTTRPHDGKPRPDTPPVPPAKPAPPARKRRITIGLDFGTATTKCIFREELESAPFHVVGFGHARDATRGILFPTAACIADGRFVFGTAAEDLGAAKTIRSFKMCLLCQASASAATTSERRKHPTCEQCAADWPGQFRMNGHTLSAEDISTLFLAVVLREAKDRAQRYLRCDENGTRFSVHLGAPLDQIGEFGNLSQLFERCVYYGWRLTDRATSGWRVEDALAALEAVRREPRPAPEMSPTYVFSETHAAITGYLVLPQSENGLYGVVDIGAGTTDVSYFWLQKDERDTKAWYYAAGSRRVGMDDIDLALRDRLASQDGRIRAARESSGDEILVQYAAIVEPVITNMHRHRVEVLEEAARVDERHRAWCNADVANYRLFFVGGGSSSGQIRGRLSNPVLASRWREPPSQLSIPASTRVVFEDEGIMTLGDFQQPGLGSLLLVAYGLAFRRPDIPKYERDRDGVHQPPPKSAPEDRHEGHWW